MNKSDIVTKFLAGRKNKKSQKQLNDNIDLENHWKQERTSLSHKNM